MISGSKAKELADDQLSVILANPDPMAQPLIGAALGEPIMVRTTSGQPSYWLVPIQHAGSSLGYIEVGEQGEILGHTYLYTRPHEAHVCPPVATRITAEEARRLLHRFGHDFDDASLSEAVYVHDGPHNRLAWMFEVIDDGQVIKWLFATPGYVYERKPFDPPAGLRGGC